jgi:hypothetical protein
MDKNLKKSNLNKFLFGYLQKRIALCAYETMLKGRDQLEWIGVWMVAIDRHLVRIVVIDVLFYFNLAAILE